MPEKCNWKLCVFRNPSKEVSAGALIDQCGLKGAAIGDAKVSEKHANFLINSGHATAAQMLALIDRVQAEVYKKTGVQLESEVRILP
jgi:UDP-N-acetylmuramate dehydrogenase